MVSLLLASAFFVGIHLFVSGTALRGRIVERIGERGFQGAFSLASLAGIVWMCSAYADSATDPLWSAGAGLRWLALPVMLVAFLFVAVGLTSPSPTAVGGESALEGEGAVRGIVRITRHPFLWGVALWAAMHLLLNGDLASLVFFGALILLALEGTRSIDRKRARALGGSWERFRAATSNPPFLAIAQGRGSLRLGELGWWRIALALALYVGFLLLHPWIFGGNALPG